MKGTRCLAISLSYLLLLPCLTSTAAADVAPGDVILGLASMNDTCSSKEQFG